MRLGCRRAWEGVILGFVVVLKRNVGEKWGLSLLTADEHDFPIVVGVSELVDSPVMRWLRYNGGPIVQGGDVLLSVNGLKGSVAEMMQECRSVEEELTLVARHIALCFLLHARDHDN